MPPDLKRLAVLGLQQTFLQLVYDQLRELTDGKLWIRTVSLNELDEHPLEEDETVLFFSKGLKAIVEKQFPANRRYFHARRENLICNMRELFALGPGHRILVVNDVKVNTDEMTGDLRSLGLPHTFLPYYPAEGLPLDIDVVITAGERMLVPAQLREKRIIDIGLRFISLETVFALFDFFRIDYTPVILARRYMRTMMMLSEKWPVLGEDRFRRPHWFGLRQDTSAAVTFDDLIQRSPAMQAFCREAAKMALTDAPIHIHGQIGTGKIRVAQAIHNASPYSRGPFISINCSARSPETLERELFGWENGTATYKSLFETAENGTLCIEEVDKLPEKLQSRLLQAVAEKQIVRTDGNGVVEIHIRLITTAGQRLDLLSPDSFNPGLLLRITRHICRIPALPERMEDFEELVGDYVKKQLDKPQLIIPEDTLAILKTHSWEGNIQELYNVLQHAVCMSADTLDKANLPYYITAGKSTERSTALNMPFDREAREDFAAITRDIITHGFLGESREILGIYNAGKEKNLAYGRTTIQTLLRDKGIRLSMQQLRLRLERLDKLGLLIVRPGRSGTTISELGEGYLKSLPDPGISE